MQPAYLDMAGYHFRYNLYPYVGFCMGIQNQAEHENDENCGTPLTTLWQLALRV